MTPYDDPLLKELSGYLEAKEPGRRERADAWATAIGLQAVDGLTPSPYFYEVAKRHIEGDISAGKARDLVDDYYETRAGRELPEDLKEADKVAARIIEVIDSEKRPGKGGQKKVVRKGCQKTIDKLIELITAQPDLTQEGMSKALGIARQAVQKHLANLKSAGRLRRVGPDKGGHWTVLAAATRKGKGAAK